MNSIYQQSFLQHASTVAHKGARRHEHTHAHICNNTHSLSPSHTNIHHVVEEGWHLLPLTTFLSFPHALSFQTFFPKPFISLCPDFLLFYFLLFYLYSILYSISSLHPVKLKQGTNHEGSSGSIPCVAHSSSLPPPPRFSVHLVCCLFAQKWEPAVRQSVR